MLDPFPTSDQAEARQAMGRQIHVDLERTIPAPPARVHAALADYHGRARVLPDSYLDWTVEEGGEGGGTVVSYRLRLSTIWEGHGGVGGFFERTFAPRSLRRIHGELLDRLTRQLGAEPGG
jgi:hypothetical protein